PDLDPVQQLLEPERLGHVVVGASLQAGNRDMDAGAGGEDDHGQTHAPASHLGLDFVSVHEGETEVEDDQVACGVAGGVGGGAAVLDDQGRVAGGLEPLLQEGGDAGFVLCDQDSGHVSSSNGTAGSSMVNLVRPGLESSPTVPPCPSTMARTIARPSPAPVALRRDGSPR